MTSLGEEDKIADSVQACDNQSASVARPVVGETSKSATLDVPTATPKRSSEPFLYAKFVTGWPKLAFGKDIFAFVSFHQSL